MTRRRWGRGAIGIGSGYGITWRMIIALRSWLGKVGFWIIFFGNWMLGWEGERGGGCVCLFGWLGLMRGDSDVGKIRGGAVAEPD